MAVWQGWLAVWHGATQARKAGSTGINGTWLFDTGHGKYSAKL